MVLDTRYSGWVFFSRRDVFIANVTSYFTLQIAVDVSTVNHTGQATPCLELSIKGLGTKVVMHPWDLTASASLGSMAVKEMTFGSDGVPLYLVQTPVGAELLSVKFVKVNQNVLLNKKLSERTLVGGCITPRWGFFVSGTCECRNIVNC